MLKKNIRLPDTELEIMQVIWSRPSPISTSQIKVVLEETRPWNISALQTLLNRLIERGFLDSDKEGKNRIYKPLIEEERYLAMENKSFLEKLNGNSITRLVASLYDSRAISDQDLAELESFIERKTKGE